MSIARQYAVGSVDKKPEAKPSAKLSEALDIISKIETEKREPKKPFTQKRKITSIRLQPEAEAALKSNGVNISDLANTLLTDYALARGWL